MYQSTMDNASLRITQHQQFNLKDFSERWQRARLSALKNAVPRTTDSQVLSPSESDLLKQTSVQDRDKVLRGVFDYSRKFGISAARFLNVTFEISDLAEILPQLGSPCFQFKWSKHNSAQVLKRAGCESLDSLGSFGCDYWREALDGLVVGIGDCERLSRHRSRGHGDDECIDVLFSEEYTMPKVVTMVSGDEQKITQKFGPLPLEIKESLLSVQERLEQMKVKLVLEGLSEGILYYRIIAEEGVLCGAGGKLIHESFTKELSKLYPKLSARDVEPIAVYGGAS